MAKKTAQSMLATHSKSQVEGIMEEACAIERYLQGYSRGDHAYGYLLLHLPNNFYKQDDIVCISQIIVRALCTEKCTRTVVMVPLKFSGSSSSGRLLSLSVGDLSLEYAALGDKDEGRKKEHNDLNRVNPSCRSVPCCAMPCQRTLHTAIMTLKK